MSDQDVRASNNQNKGNGEDSYTQRAKPYYEYDHRDNKNWKNRGKDVNSQQESSNNP